MPKKFNLFSRAKKLKGKEKVIVYIHITITLLMFPFFLLSVMLKLADFIIMILPNILAGYAFNDFDKFFKVDVRKILNKK